MKKSVIFLAIAIIVLGALSVAAQEGRGTGRVRGKVLDEKGKPIVGANITMVSDEFTATFSAVSDKNGEWAIMGFSGGMWKITASAPGYAPKTKLVRLTQLARNPLITFTLKKGEPGKAALAPGSKKIFDTALEAYNAGKYDEALAGFQKFLEKNPTLYQTHINIGNCYRKLNKYEEAIAEYKEVLKYEPTSVQALTNLGECYAKEGHLDKAKKYFEKVTAQSPNDPVVFYNLAEIYFNAGAVDDAIENYQKALELKPDWPPAIIKLGYAYLNKNDIPKAVTYFKKYLEVAPDGPDAPVAKQLLEQFKDQPPNK